MIGTAPKPMEEIEEALRGCDKVIVLGCGGCAKVCHTGGQPEVEAMAEELKKRGKTVLAVGVPERACYIHHTKATMDEMQDALKECDAIVELGCGGAVQTVRQATEEYGLIKRVVSGLNSVGHMDTIVPDALWIERCLECGDCVLNETGGICPITLCAKSLLNGPCGGAKDGKCEVDPDRDCAWHLIYERLKALGELDKMRKLRPPKDYSKMARPRRIEYQAQ